MMLRSLKDLRGYTIQATDGEIGKVDGFYFDDQSWTVRYLVVSTGNWLSGRQVLISPEALGQPDWLDQKLPVSLTQEQVKNSPEIDTEKPVSRQHEIELSNYYRWPVYWSGSFMTAGIGLHPVVPVVVEPVPPQQMAESGDPHLRSTQEVIGYYIIAADGDIGHVEDFMADDQTWVIHYLIVDTRNWLPGKKVLIAPQWVKEIDWTESKVHVEMTRDHIKNSPEYNPASGIDRPYEERLYQHYGFPRYWI